MKLTFYIPYSYYDDDNDYVILSVINNYWKIGGSIKKDEGISLRKGQNQVK